MLRAHHPRIQRAAWAYISGSTSYLAGVACFSLLRDFVEAASLGAEVFFLPLFTILPAGACVQRWRWHAAQRRSGAAAAQQVRLEPDASTGGACEWWGWARAADSLVKMPDHSSRGSLGGHPLAVAPTHTTPLT